MGINPSTTWAIEAMAALEDYAGKHGIIGESSFPLYAVCLQLSNASGIKSWISIQDLKPLQQMQDHFCEPWKSLPVPPRAYDGPLPTLPTYIPDMEAAQSRLRNEKPEIGAFMIDGAGLEVSYVMPVELQGQDYVDEMAKKSHVEKMTLLG